MRKVLRFAGARDVGSCSASSPSLSSATVTSVLLGTDAGASTRTLDWLSVTGSVMACVLFRLYFRVDSVEISAKYL